MKGLKVAWAVGSNTFREAIRSRVLHAVLAVAVVGVIGSVLVAEMSLENNARVIRDLGYSLLSLTLSVVAILAGVTFLNKDLARKTIYSVVTKPVSRSNYLLGKYVGLLLILGACTAVLGTVLLGTIVVTGETPSLILFQGMWLSYCEAAIVAAFATLCASFSTPILSGLMTFGFFLLGRLRDELQAFSKVYKGPLGAFMELLALPVPDLALFDANLQVANLVSLRWDYVGYATGYAILLISGLLLLSCIIFQRRDFV